MRILQKQWWAKWPTQRTEWEDFHQPQHMVLWCCSWRVQMSAVCSQDDCDELGEKWQELLSGEPQIEQLLASKCYITSIAPFCGMKRRIFIWVLWVLSTKCTCIVYNQLPERNLNDSLILQIQIRLRACIPAGVYILFVGQLIHKNDNHSHHQMKAKIIICGI